MSISLKSQPSPAYHTLPNSFGTGIPWSSAAAGGIAVVDFAGAAATDDWVAMRPIVAV